MSVHVIGNPVPTPEEMGEILGLSSERVASVRAIMNAPSRRKASRRTSTSIKTVSPKKPASGNRSSKASGTR